MSELEKYESFDELKKQDSSIGYGTNPRDLREFINFISSELDKQNKLKK